VAGLARVAETAGLDGVWAEDTFAAGDRSVLDVTLTLAVAAAVTSRISVGFAIFVPSLRPLGWAARQVASLQHYAGGRLQLGVGIGGGRSESEYLAVGVRRQDRAARTDDFLQLLPDLLGGRSAVIPDCSSAGSVRLLPAVAMPPVWIGGTSAAALRRAVRFGDGWLSGFQTPAEFAASARQLGELAAAAGRARPRLGVSMSACIGTAGSAGSLADVSVAIMQSAYGVPASRARDLAIGGTAAQVADHLAAFVAAGAELLVVQCDPAPSPDSWELLGKVRQLLTGLLRALTGRHALAATSAQVLVEGRNEGGEALTEGAR
jgi:alkanesulfonate monooxygenase SsuD/methylene tetrahydromethanopterin reductase-like flavin-dependent oxidoreductase (luciferase family)